MRTPTDLRKEQDAAGVSSAGRRTAAGALGWPEGFVSSEEDRAALLVLSGFATLTARWLLELAHERRTASACLAAILDGGAGTDIHRRRASSLDGARVNQALRSVGAAFVAVGNDGYPDRLLDLFDPPAGIFVRPEGPQPFPPGERCIAIVGARNCSAAGKEVAGWVAGRLAAAGVCVVSGGARGIDAAAHRGAMDAGGRTIAVLGSGIDVAYPRENRGLLARVAESGWIVSEYPPGTPAEPFRFPARNRIVAALSSGVVVVEGTATSGSMITADHALDLGREVFAVPGPVTSELAEAPLRLIREGAVMIRGPDDLLADLGIAWDVEATDRVGRPVAPDHGRPSTPDHERALWEALRAAATADQLAAATRLSTPEAMSALLGLELRGLVIRSGGRYTRSPRSWAAGAASPAKEDG